MQIEAKLEAMGIVLPAQPAGLPGVTVRFSRVRVRGNRAYIAGHGPQSPDSSVVLPRGKVGAELTLEQGYEAFGVLALAQRRNLHQQARGGRYHVQSSASRGTRHRSILCRGRQGPLRPVLLHALVKAEIGINRNGGRVRDGGGWIARYIRRRRQSAGLLSRSA